MQYMQRSRHFISGFSLYQWETLHNHLVFQKLEHEFSLIPNKRRLIEQSINFNNFNTVMRVLQCSQTINPFYVLVVVCKHRPNSILFFIDSSLVIRVLHTTLSFNCTHHGEKEYRYANREEKRLHIQGGQSKEEIRQARNSRLFLLLLL